MRKIRLRLDRHFKPYWKHYVLQSLLAAAAVWIAAEALRQQNLVITASLAATAFTVFAMPGSVTATPRHVIGGHLIGLVFGSIFALAPAGCAFSQDAIYALAVGCAMFLMTITNTEHPPAAGTALGVVMAGFAARVILGVVIGVAILTMLHSILRPFLRDLVPLHGNEDG